MSRLLRPSRPHLTPVARQTRRIPAAMPTVRSPSFGSSLLHSSHVAEDAVLIVGAVHPLDRPRSLHVNTGFRNSIRFAAQVETRSLLLTPQSIPEQVCPLISLAVAPPAGDGLALADGISICDSVQQQHSPPRRSASWKLRCLPESAALHGQSGRSPARIKPIQRIPTSRSWKSAQLHMACSSCTARPDSMAVNRPDPTCRVALRVCHSQVGQPTRIYRFSAWRNSIRLSIDLSRLLVDLLTP